MTDRIRGGGVVEFGRFRFDLEVGELRRDDELVALRPKAMAVLRELVADAGSLVSHTRLLEAGWGDAHVDEDAALHGVVREIRAALGDTAAEADYVATVHRRGYRFVAEVRPVATEPERQAEAVAASRPWRWVAAAVLLVALGAGGWYFTRPATDIHGHPIADASPLVLRGRYLVETGDAEAIARGAAILREAVAQGAGPLAWSGIAVAEIRLGRYEEAKEAALRTLEGLPDDANAHRILGQIALGEGKMADAETHLLRALELDPSSGRAHHAWALYLASIGDVAQAVSTAEVARSLAPGSEYTRANLARFLLYLGDYRRTIEESDENDKSETTPLFLRLSCLESRQVAGWLLEDFDTSRAALARYIEHLGADAATLDEIRSAGAREGAERALRWRVEHHLASADESPRHHVDAALVLTQLGDFDRAAAQLALALERDLHVTPSWLEDPRLDPLRGTPELTALQARHRGQPLGLGRG